MKTKSCKIKEFLDVRSGLSKSHCDAIVFYLEFVPVKYIWVHVRPC